MPKTTRKLAKELPLGLKFRTDVMKGWEFVKDAPKTVLAVSPEGERFRGACPPALVVEIEEGD